MNFFSNCKEKNMGLRLLLIIAIILYSVKGVGQCPMIGANGVFNPNDDILLTSYHQSIVRTTTGLVTWGENMRSNGADALTITAVTPANGYNYTGTILGFALSGNTNGQGFLATTTDLYAWGPPGEVVSTSFVSNANFAPMLNVPFAASSIIDIHANSDVLFVVLNTGEVWVATTGTTIPNGNASTNGNIWHRVETSAGVPLTGVVQIIGIKVVGLANAVPNFKVATTVTPEPVLIAYADEQVSIRLDLEAGFQPIIFNDAITRNVVSNTVYFISDRKSINDTVGLNVQYPQFTLLPIIDPNEFC